MTAAAALVMSDGQREALQALSRSQTAPHRQVQRAKALLLAADGVANMRIAAQVGVKPATVRAWRAPVAEEGLAEIGGGLGGRGREGPLPPVGLVGSILCGPARGRTGRRVTGGGGPGERGQTER